MRIFLLFLFMVIGIIFGLSAKDVEDEDGSKVDVDKKTIYKYRKDTAVKFSEVELEGAFQKPEGYYSLKAKKTKFEALITPKYDFMDELKNSVFHIDED